MAKPNQSKGKDTGLFSGVAFLLVVVGMAFHQEIFSVYRSLTGGSGNSATSTAEAPTGLLDGILAVLLDLALAAGIVFLVVVGWKLWLFFRPIKMRTIRVQLQDEMDLKPQRAQALAETFGTLWERKGYKRFFQGRTWIVLQIMRNKNGQFTFHYRAPVKKAGSVLRRIRSAYPDAVVDYDREYRGIPFLQDREGIGGHLKMTKPKKGYGLNADPSHRFGDVLAMMPRGSVLQVSFSPDSSEEMAEDGQEQVRDIMKKRRKIREDTKKIIDASNRYIGRSAFKVSVFLWSDQYNVTDLADEIQAQTKGDHNTLTFHRYRWGMKWRNPLRYWFVSPLTTRQMVMNDQELAHFLQLPDPTHEHIWEDLQITVKKKLPARNELQKGIRIGQVDDPAGKHRDARLRTKTLVNHGIIAGMAGGGKGAVFNYFMEDFLKDWVKQRNAPGLTYADPHRRGILNIINQLIEMEKEGAEVPWDRVMVLSVGPSEYPAPLNILHRPSGEDVDQVAGEAVEAIMSAFSGDLSRSRVQMENAIHGLLWDDQPHTIRDIGRVFRFSEGKLRRRLRERLQNPMVKEWFMNELEPKFNPDKPQDVNVDAITTRVNPFLSKRAMQRIFAQPDNALDVAKILKDGYLVLIDFLGAPDEAYKLTAGWLTNRYFREAQKRIGGGREHFLVYDECQKFHVPAFTNIAKENRKFDLGLILMTQEVHKLDKDLLSAMGTNSGFVCSVQQSTGAKVTTELMRDEFTQGQLKRLNRVLDEKGQVKQVEAALWSVDGSSHIIAPPPAFLLQGESTKLGSPEEKQAISQAEKKMVELMKRHAKHKDEVDRILSGEKKEKEAQKIDVNEASAATQSVSTKKITRAFSADELEQAIDLVIQEQKASASFIQRQLRIGSNKAAKLIKALEDRRIIGPSRGNRPREVLVKDRADVS